MKIESNTQTHLVLESKQSWRSLELGDLWRYRELLFFLTWRDIQVHYYEQALLGAA